MRLLEKLLRDDLDSRKRQNLTRYRSFRQMLDEAIARYNNRAIQAADVIAVMVEIRQQQLQDERRKQELGLSDEGLGLYDVVCRARRMASPPTTPGSPAWCTTWWRPCAATSR
jgi:type I restriction enzyme R subunit